LPVRVSYNVAKILKVLSVEHELFMQKRQEIVNKYAEKDDKGIIQVEGAFVKIKPEFAEQAGKAINELMSIEVKFDFEPIKLEQLENVSLKPVDLLSLEEFIAE